MGNNQIKQMKNYSLTFAPESIPLTKQKLTKTSKAYTNHLLPEEYEVHSYSLASKTHLNNTNIKQFIFPKPKHITLLTYNVWFQDHNANIRYQCLLKLLSDSKADFICLQEVNSKFLNLIHQSAKQFTGYYDYFMPVMKMHWYDTLILSKYPCKFYKKTFQCSGMGRCNLTAVIEFSEENKEQTFKLGINCVHLESLNSTPHRIAQLKQIQVLNKYLDMSIIAGDFNFSDNWQQNKSIKQYTDIWKTGKRHYSKWANQEMKQLGYTMPPTNRFPAWRPDHVIYKMKKKIQKKDQDEIGIIGDFTVPPYEDEHFSKIAVDHQVRTPSDHFGLICKINIS